MIVVTGAAGRLGRRVVQRLVDDGFDVLGTDKVSCEDSPAPYQQADLCDASQANAVLKHATALIHMGAIPGPLRHGPHEIFENNVQSTFNILMAAADQKLRRVVFSSSAFGMGWLAKSPYEWSHHVKIGHDFGVTDDDIRALIKDTNGEDSGLPELDLLVLRAAREITNDGAMAGQTFGALEKHLSKAHLVDLTVTISFYNAVVRFLGTMGMDVEESYQPYLDAFPLPQ